MLFESGFLNLLFKCSEFDHLKILKMIVTNLVDYCFKPDQIIFKFKYIFDTEFSRLMSCSEYNHINDI